MMPYSVHMNINLTFSHQNNYTEKAKSSSVDRLNIDVFEFAEQRCVSFIKKRFAELHKINTSV